MTKRNHQLLRHGTKDLQGDWAVWTNDNNARSIHSGESNDIGKIQVKRYNTTAFNLALLKNHLIWFARKILPRYRFGIMPCFLEDFSKVLAKVFIQFQCRHQATILSSTKCSCDMAAP